MAIGFTPIVEILSIDEEMKLCLELCNNNNDHDYIVHDLEKLLSEYIDKLNYHGDADDIDILYTFFSKMFVKCYLAIENSKLQCDNISNLEYSNSSNNNVKNNILNNGILSQQLQNTAGSADKFDYDNIKSKRFGIRLSDDLYDNLKSESSSQGRSVANLIRKILYDYYYTGGKA